MRAARRRTGAAARAAALAGALAWALLAAAPAAQAQERSLKLATTTSTENSGLLAHLLPRFEERCGCAVRVIPVGTGKALRIAEAGDADALLVHSPEAEEAFVAAGHGVGRTFVMHNDFVLLGPREDPARIGAGGDILGALAAIRDSGSAFVSRGDDSGTHKKELELWSLLAGEDGDGGPPRGSEWYLETGSGMGQAILVADQKRAYVLSDRGTFLFFEDKVDLGLSVGDPSDPLLYNPYSAIAVNPALHPHVEHELATELIRWLSGEEARALIDGYEVRGERLFFAR